MRSNRWHIALIVKASKTPCRYAQLKYFNNALQLNPSWIVINLYSQASLSNEFLYDLM